MKKLFITAVTAITLSVTAFAADRVTSVATGEENITYAALSHFNADFRSATNPAWTVTANCQKVVFTLDGAKLTAFYNFEGEYLGSTQDVAYSTIPATAQKKIATDYAGYTPGQVIKYENFDTDAAEPAYFVELKKDKTTILVKVTPEGYVSFFKKVK